MEDFSRNPCRHHLFEVFALDKSETDLRAILTTTQAARDRLHFGKIVARDGTEIQISESELNALEKGLLTPVERLKAEQFVHQAHTFSRDPELAWCIEGLTGEDVDALPELLAEVQGQTLLAVVRTTMPLLAPPPLADDLPWPPEPESRAPQRETLAEAVLRDR
jgi:hypothetical protein